VAFYFGSNVFLVLSSNRFCAREITATAPPPVTDCTMLVDLLSLTDRSSTPSRC